MKVVPKQECCNGNCEQGRFCERHIERKARNSAKLEETLSRFNWPFIGVIAACFAFWGVVIWGLLS